MFAVYLLGARKALALRSISKIWFLPLIRKEAGINSHNSAQNENYVHLVSICWASTCYTARHQGYKKEPEVEDIQSNNSTKGEQAEELPCLFHMIAVVTLKHYFNVNARQFQNYSPQQKEINEIQMHR